MFCCASDEATFKFKQRQEREARLHRREASERTLAGLFPPFPGTPGNRAASAMVKRFLLIFIGAVKCGLWASGDLRFECAPEHTRPMPLILFVQLGGLRATSGTASGDRRQAQPLNKTLDTPQPCFVAEVNLRLPSHLYLCLSLLVFPYNMESFCKKLPSHDLQWPCTLSRSSIPTVLFLLTCTSRLRLRGL